MDFLHYVENSDPEHVSRDCDERLLHLNAIVEEIKASAQMGVTYMKWETREREIREDGIEEGRIEGARNLLLSKIQKKLDKGKEVEQIADELEEDAAVIRELINHMKTAQDL